MDEIRRDALDGPGLCMTRREVLCRSGVGMGALALASLLGHENGRAALAAGGFDCSLRSTCR